MKWAYLSRHETDTRAMALPRSNKTSIVSGGRQKIQTTFENGDELVCGRKCPSLNLTRSFSQVEEYDLQTDELVVRKFRIFSLNKKTEWVYEVGLPPLTASNLNSEKDLLLRENPNQPVLTRKDSAHEFQWRIRNLPYSVDVYQISVAEETQEIVVRTTNKKFEYLLFCADSHICLTLAGITSGLLFLI